MSEFGELSFRVGRSDLVTFVQLNFSLHYIIQGGSKSKLLILSNYVSKTEKVGGT